MTHLPLVPHPHLVSTLLCLPPGLVSQEPDIIALSMNRVPP